MKICATFNSENLNLLEKYKFTGNYDFGYTGFMREHNYIIVDLNDKSFYKYEGYLDKVKSEELDQFRELNSMYLREVLKCLLD